MNVAAAIFAGGGGTRMGERGMVKGLLKVGGARIIDRQLAVLRPLFAEILLAANDPAPWEGLGLRVIPDRSVSGPLPPAAGGGLGRGASATPTLGPIAGIDAILAALSPTIDAVVCVAGDMPFLQAPLLAHLRDAASTGSALVPRISGRSEPLLARYSRAISPIVTDQIAAGRYALVDLLARLGAGVTWIDEPQLRGLDPDLRSIVNVNTPADLRAYDSSKGP